MTHLIQFLFWLIASSARSHLSLQLEVAALRHQLSVYQAERRMSWISSSDRLLWSLVSKWWSGWRKSLYFDQPRTVVAWQKQRFRDYWRGLSQHGRPKIAPELRKLIKRMWRANPTWGSPRIVSELRMLGIDVAKPTLERYKPRHRKPPSPSWKTFLEQHAHELASIDFFVVPTARLKVVFVLVVLVHDRRRIVHFNVTEHPTALWTAQQITEAFPFDTAPRYLLRDGDGNYGRQVQRRVRSLGMKEVITTPASPWQNPYVERVIGSLRRELLDHVIVLNQRHLKRLLASYVDYYHPWRTHRSLDQDAPVSRAVQIAKPEQIAEFPVVHGLHHYYLSRAA